MAYHVHPTRWSSRAPLPAALALILVGCGEPDPPPPLRIAMLFPSFPMPSRPDGGTPNPAGGMPPPADGGAPPPPDGGSATKVKPGTQPNMEWSLDNVNAGGGVAGLQLALDYYFYDPHTATTAEIQQRATELATDD